MVKEDISNLMWSDLFCFKRTVGCHTTKPKLTGSSMENACVDVLYLATRQLPSLVSFGLSSVQTADVHWVADAVQSLWNIASGIWNGQVETEAMSCFSGTAMLTGNPFEIRFGWSSSTIRPKLLVY